MKTITQHDINLLLQAVEQCDQIAPLSAAQMRALTGGRRTTLAEYCDTAMMIIQNNDVEGNTGLETVWNNCFSYWDAKY